MPDESTASQARLNFDAAATYFIEIASQVSANQWNMPGLGEWTVRELAGHTARALETVTTYIAQPAEVAELADSLAYFMAALAITGDGHTASQAIAERGRQAGKDLGAEPVAGIRLRQEMAMKALANSDDEMVITTPMGSIALHDYLDTRTFELIIHSLDIARAIEVTAVPPPGALETAVILATKIALGNGHGVQVGLALTGRTPLGESLKFL